MKAIVRWNRWVTLATLIAVPLVASFLIAAFVRLDADQLFFGALVSVICFGGIVVGGTSWDLFGGSKHQDSR